MPLSDFLKFDRSDQIRSPDLGAGYWDQVAEDKKFPGISASGDPGDFPDPNVPAVAAPDKTVLDLLEQIRDRLPEAASTTVWETRVITLPAAVYLDSIRSRQPWKYFFLTNNSSRVVSVYLGNGQTFFLGNVPAFKQMYGEVPYFQDEITIKAPTGVSDTEQVTIVFSNEKVSVTIT